MADERIPQSITKRVALKAYLSSDHVSAATGKTIAVVISKNGAAFANPSAGATNATEIANGWYYVDLSTTDTGTLGPLIVRGTAATIDDAEAPPIEVVSAHNAGFDALPAVAAEAAGGLYTRGSGAGQINQPANGQIDANTVKLSGTSQTARDIGASVLLSAGSGAGQLDFTSGVVKSSLTQILGTALTETAGQIAGGFKKFFNVAAPVLDTTSVNQTGDAYARLGNPAGASVSVDVAAVKGDTAGIKTKTDSLTFTGAGKVDSSLRDWLGTAPDALSSGKIPADLKLWLAAAPASLTASGYVQSMLLRWLTDNAGGTPNALVSNRVDASAGAVADKTGYTVSTVQDKTGYSLSAAGVQAVWDALTSALVTVNSIGSLLTTNINAAINSRMATFSLPTNFSSLAIDVSGRIDLGKWLGSVPAALSGVAGYVQTMLRRWLTDDAAGTPLALSTNLVQSTGGGGGGGGTIYGSSGSIAYTYTVTKPGGSIPLAGATVWVSSDLAGVNRSQAQISDALGRVQFSLDPSTVYFWRRHSDWVFVDPDVQTVS